MFKNQNSVNVVALTEPKNKSFALAGKDKNLFQFTRKANKAQVKNQLLDAETKHRIYDRLISLLEGRRYSDLPFVLHPKTACFLREADRMTEIEINKLERSIIEEVPVQRHSSTIPGELLSALIRQKKSQQIFDKRIVRIPDEELNLAVCGQLEKEFSRADLLKCSGFTVEDGLFLMLDIGKHLIERGFLMPYISNVRTGLIAGLEVFRNAQDNAPFLLRSRSKGVELCK